MSILMIYIQYCTGGLVQCNAGLKEKGIFVDGMIEHVEAQWIL